MKSTEGSRLILASASPRRAELLRRGGFAFDVMVSPLAEPSRKPAGIAVEHWPMSLAYLKAAAVLEMLRRHGEDDNVMVLAADTIVVLKTQPRGLRILNKPADRSHARRMLQRLSGKTHTVITGLCLLTPTARRLSSATATCQFQKLTPKKLEAYLNSNRWKGKAGAYGIQNHDPFVKLLTGEITTVIGLPMPLLKRELKSIAHPAPPDTRKDLP